MKGRELATAAPRTDEAVEATGLPNEFAHSTFRLCRTGFLNSQAKTLFGYDQAEATPGVLLWAFCGKSNVNTSGSVPVFSISTPPFASAACVMNPISG